MPRPNLTVLIPVHEASHALNACLQSLLESSAELGEIYVIEAAAASGVSSCEESTYEHRVKCLRYAFPANATELCRWAFESIPLQFSDVLILDASVAIGKEALQEMMAVLELYERHAIVVPRSNEPGIGGIPLTGPELSPDRSYRVWKSLQSHLPRYQTVSSADAACMLIRREAVERFGLFPSDPTAQAYGERINRYGYSTVVANRAFVPVSSPSRSAGAEDFRSYIEFDADPADYFAGLVVPHRPRILVDLYHLAPQYYGTAEFGLNLLRELRHLTSEIEFYIDIQPASLEFFLPELQGYRLYSEEGEPQLFDLVFKPTQINAWDELRRMNRFAPIVTYTILDMIAVRCSYLSAPGRRMLFRTAAELCDRVFTLSHSASRDFTALSGNGSGLDVVHLGTNYGFSAHERVEGRYILLMGNAYTHKGIRETLAALEGETLPIVVLGGSARTTESASNVRYLESGGVSRAMMRATLAGAKVVVYPSHYEGFGLPVLDALALKKQVIVLNNNMNQEMDQLARSSGLQLISSTRELREAVKRAWTRKADGDVHPRHWRSTAREYLDAFRTLLDRGTDYERLNARWNFLRAQKA